MERLKYYRELFQSEDLYANNTDDLSVLIKAYVRTYCSDQNLPQISVRFTDLKNGGKTGFCCPEDNLIVFNDKLFSYFEEDKAKPIEQKVTHFSILSVVEHELDHFKQYLNKYSEQEKWSIERPLSDLGYFNTEHEYKTHQRTLNILNDIANIHKNEYLKKHVKLREQDLTIKTQADKTRINTAYPKGDFLTVIKDMQKDAQFSLMLLKNLDLQKINIKRHNTLNLKYNLRIENQDVNINSFEEDDKCVCKLSTPIDIHKTDVVEFGIKDGTLTIFDLYVEEENLDFKNTVYKGNFFKQNTINNKLLDTLKCIVKEYEDKTNTKITNIDFNYYMTSYDESLRKQVLKEILKCPDLRKSNINFKNTDKNLIEYSRQTSSKKYLEDLFFNIKNIDNEEIRNVILPEQIKPKDFNYYINILTGNNFNFNTDDIYKIYRYIITNNIPHNATSIKEMFETENIKNILNDTFVKNDGLDEKIANVKKLYYKDLNLSMEDSKVMKAVKTAVNIDDGNR